ncbi:MAG: hypothetical protein AB1414_16135 [bacterium]
MNKWIVRLAIVFVGVILSLNLGVRQAISFEDANDSPLYKSTLNTALKGFNGGKIIVAQAEVVPGATGPGTPGEIQVRPTMLPEITKCPVERTVCPELKTRCPQVDTECPPCVTKEPTEKTQCPVERTVCPELKTRCPQVDTECPPCVTKEPGARTQCPVDKTVCPVVRTNCPVIKTDCPVNSVECITMRPIRTICPPVGVKTQCPVERTVCPVKRTVCPEIRTRCPIPCPVEREEVE